MTGGGASATGLLLLPTYTRSFLIKVKDRYFTNLDRLPAWTAIGTTVLADPGFRH